MNTKSQLEHAEVFFDFLNSSSHEAVFNYLSCYLKGLQDGEAIGNYEIIEERHNPLNPFFYHILKIEILDEKRKEQIDTTLRTEYRAEPATISKTH